MNEWSCISTAVLRWNKRKIRLNKEIVLINKSFKNQWVVMKTNSDRWTFQKRKWHSDWYFLIHLSALFWRTENCTYSTEQLIVSPLFLHSVALILQSTKVSKLPWSPYHNESYEIAQVSISACKVGTSGRQLMKPGFRWLELAELWSVMQQQKRMAFNTTDYIQ